MKLVAISGSLRKKSFNTGLLRYVIEHAPEGVEIELADISKLPLFNQDHEDPCPEVVGVLKEQVKAADGVLISSPEYNHSVPGVLKNAIDWLSRPPKKSAIAGRPVALMGASPSFVGTARGQEHLKLVFSGSGMRLYPGSHVAVGLAGDKFDDESNLTDESTQKFARSYVEGFVEWIRERS